MRCRHINIGWMLLAAWLLPGCMDTFDEETAESMEISLRSRITTSALDVRSSSERYDYDSVISGGLDISMVRWDEGSSRTWPDDYGQPLSAVLGESPDPNDGWTREIHFDPAEYFEDKVSEVGFMGWYPSQGWTLSDGSVFGKKDGDVVMEYGLLKPHADGRAYVEDCPEDIMFADFRSGSFGSPIEPMLFRHALCRYNLYVYAVDEEVRDQWGRLKEIEFMNLPEKLVVTLPGSLPPAAGENVTFSYEDDAREVPVVTRIEGDGLSMPVGIESRKLLGTYLGGVPAEGILGLSAVTENDNAQSPVSIVNNFRPGYTYNIILRFSTHGIINAEVVIEDWTPFDADVESESDIRFFVDLSRYGTSNSYVVSSSNMGYSFDATVKGNGVNTLQKYDGTTIYLPDTDVSLKTDHVRIISSDAKLKLEGDDYVPVPAAERGTQFVSLISERLSDGKVLFEVLGSEDKNDFRLQYKGNVRIAGYDIMDNLIWSWHIWVTDKPMLINYGNGEISMDRNLGSMSNDPSDWNPDNNALSGVCYQWGRKDPVLLIRDSLDKYKTFAPQTLQWAHANPKAFIYTESDASSHRHDWLDVSNDHLWGYVSERDDMVKTLYDPCPPGYRVNGNALWEYSTALSKEPELEYASGTNVGYTFPLDDGTEVFYPASSFVTHDGRIVRNLDVDENGNPVEDNHYAYVYRYSATPYVTDDPHKQGLAYHFDYNWADDRDGTIYDLIVSDEHDGGGRIHAFPVRCVYEDSKKEITDLSREQTANSYVLEESGYYKFDATAPGNSVGSLNVQFTNGTIRNITFDGGIPEVLTSVVKVDLLWWQGDLSSGSAYMDFIEGLDPSADNTGLIASACPLKMLDGGALDDEGDALFRLDMGRYPEGGNVILAGFDTNGDIQWTWHMWMVPEGLDVDVVCCNNAGVKQSPYSLMDRNLGATRSIQSISDVNGDNALSTCGFFYQWGRKDPFVPNVTVARNNSYRNTSSPWCYKDPETGRWEVRNTLDRAGVASTIKETVQNPTVFRGDASHRGWQTMYNNETGNDGPVNQMWGYTGVEGAWGNTFAKTMWDPCPPGYRLANHLVFEAAGLVINDSDSGHLAWMFYNGHQTSSYGIFVEEGMSLHESGSGGNERYMNLSEGFWLPFTKHINPRGEYAYTDSQDSDAASSIFAAITHGACPYSGYGVRSVGYGLPVNNDYSRMRHITTMIGPAYGGVVRCMKE